MGMAADATTAVTIDFLRALCLLHRQGAHLYSGGAGGAAPDGDSTVAQGREGWAAVVLTILDSQGFDRLSDTADDSGSEDETDTGNREPDVTEPPLVRLQQCPLPRLNPSRDPAFQGEEGARKEKVRPRRPQGT
jgi:hypothetical protein